MKIARAVGVGLAMAGVLATAWACATIPGGGSRWATSTLQTYDPGQWTYWGGDAGQTRYAPLNDINLANVDRLKIAWRWSADTSGGAASSNFKAMPWFSQGV